jgi:hypothetical protein
VREQRSIAHRSWAKSNWLREREAWRRVEDARRQVSP